MLYIDLRNNKAGLAMIETLRKNFESYAKKDIEKDKLPCIVQSMIGHPSNKHYKQTVSQNELTNWQIDIDDVKNTKAIFRPHGTGLKDRSTQKAPTYVSSERVYISREYYKLNTCVTLAADIMFVTGVPFFVTYSRKIKFTTGEFLPRQTARQLVHSLKKGAICVRTWGLLSDFAWWTGNCNWWKR